MNFYNNRVDRKVSEKGKSVDLLDLKVLIQEQCRK